MSDAVFSQWHRYRLRSRSRTGFKPTLSLRSPKALTATSLMVLVLAGLLLAAVLPFHPSERFVDPSPSLPPPPPPEWLDVPEPMHIFDVEAPLLRDLPLVYSARRRAAGDDREDNLAYGVPGVDTPAFRLRLTRLEREAPRPPLFADLAQQAADAGLSVSRSSLADLLPTRFGSFEIADITLTDAKLATVPCSGFRLVSATPALTIGGIACGVMDQPMTRSALACVLDWVDLRFGGDDRAMIDFFAASENRRDPNCHGARLTPDALHAAWLDDKPVTRTKTRRRR